MKILHLCLANFYIENYGYQENLIPKYNKLDGHDVTIIASRFTFNNENGEPGLTEVEEYINTNGIKVIRADYKYKWLGKLNDKLRIFKDLYRLLNEERPDLIFNHNLQLLDLKEIIRYVKENPNCKLVVDNHAAYINSGKNIFSRLILHKVLYKRVIKSSLPHISKIFVLSPGCKEFAKDMYNIPENKMEYLFLGADTNNINFGNREIIRSRVRKKLNIEEKDFVLITGGKLNKEKNTKLLLELISKISIKELKLIIFGVFSDDIRDEMLNLIDKDNRVRYIGWLDGEDVYDYYFASDVAVFLGSKSALWEQAICSGLPLICKRWEGWEYVDVGGNCIFIDGNNKDEIIESIELLMNDSETYQKMANIARTKGYDTFSYEKIARQAIEV